jgi:hypothetical protein
MTLNRILLILAASAGALALSGCGGGGGGKMAMPQPPPARFEDQFGQGFGVTFRQDRNAEAVDPAAGDLEPLSLTTEPREVS